MGDVDFRHVHGKNGESNRGDFYIFRDKQLNQERSKIPVGHNLKKNPCYY